MKRSIAKLYRKASAGELPLFDTWWAKRLLNVVHVLVIVTQQTAQDRIPVRSATLAYWTAVGAVPLMVLAFALTGEPASPKRPSKPCAACSTTPSCPT